jgi:hypothetical protein
MASCEVAIIFDFNQNWNIVTNFSKTPKYIILWKSSSSQVFHAYRQAGGQAYR